MDTQTQPTADGGTDVEIPVNVQQDAPVVETVVQPTAETGAGEAAPQTAAEAERRRARPGKLERQLRRMESEQNQLLQELRAEREARQRAEQYAQQATRSAVDTRKGSLEREERDLLVRAKQTFNEGDTDGHVAAMDRLAEIKAHKLQLAQIEQQQAAAKPRPAPAQQQFSPQAQAWMNANPWFGKDAIRTQQTQIMHVAAVERGIAPDTPAYWKFLKEGVEKVFPGTVTDPILDGAEGDPEDEPEGEEDPAPQAPAPAARAASPAPAAATRPGMAAPPPRPRETVRLTAEQMDVARFMGISPQQYAAGLASAKAAGSFKSGGR